MRRIVFLIGAAALLVPSAVIGYQPTITPLEPQTESPAMAITPPSQPAEEGIIVSVTVTPDTNAYTNPNTVTYPYSSAFEQHTGRIYERR